MAPTSNGSHMLIALDEARRAADRGEVPVGAVIVSPVGSVMARAGNRTGLSARPHMPKCWSSARHAGPSVQKGLSVQSLRHTRAMPDVRNSHLVVRIRRSMAQVTQRRRVEHGPRIFHAADAIVGDLFRYRRERAAALLKRFRGPPWSDCGHHRRGLPLDSRRHSSTDRFRRGRHARFRPRQQRVRRACSTLGVACRRAAAGWLLPESRVARELQHPELVDGHLIRMSGRWRSRSRMAFCRFGSTAP